MKALIRPAVRGLVNALDAGIGNKTIREMSSRIPVPNKEIAREVALQSRLATGKLTGSNKFDVAGEPMLAKMRDSKKNLIKIQPDDPKTGTKARSDSKRTLRAKPKGEDEAAAINKLKAKAAKRNRDLLHTVSLLLNMM